MKKNQSEIVSSDGVIAAWPDLTSCFSKKLYNGFSIRSAKFQEDAHSGSAAVSEGLIGAASPPPIHWRWLLNVPGLRLDGSQKVITTFKYKHGRYPLLTIRTAPTDNGIFSNKVLLELDSNSFLRLRLPIVKENRYFISENSQGSAPFNRFLLSEAPKAVSILFRRVT